MSSEKTQKYFLLFGCFPITSLYSGGLSLKTQNKLLQIGRSQVSITPCSLNNFEGIATSGTLLLVYIIP